MVLNPGSKIVDEVWVIHPLFLRLTAPLNRNASDVYLPIVVEFAVEPGP